MPKNNICPPMFLALLPYLLWIMLEGSKRVVYIEYRISGKRGFFKNVSPLLTTLEEEETWEELIFIK